MKSLLFFINQLGPGGAQRQLVEMAVNYQLQGYKVKILIYQRYASDYYFDYLAKNNVVVDDIDEPNHLKRLFKIRRYIRSLNPDVVIAFLETTAIAAEFAALPCKKWKLIVGERSADPRKRTSRKLRMFLRCHVFADYVVANSQANIDIIREVVPWLNPKKFRVIYNMLDASKFTMDTSYQYKSNGKTKIVVASSHRYLKNLDGLVEAVNLLPQESRDKLQIDWYGNTIELNEYSYDEANEKIDAYGLRDIFHFYPATLDIYDKMRQADAVGLFSLFEGLPNAICEAMYLGKPVIATRVSDLPLLITDENGFLCETDAQSISIALQNLIDASVQRLQTMGNKNREKAEQLFNRKEILDQYAKLF